MPKQDTEDRRGALSQPELARYARHLALPDIGIEGQQKLKAASVLVVGTGGLGSPVCLYLAAAGVGKLGIVDFDQVDESNLQRQIIHGTDDVGRSKTQSAQESISKLNPLVDVEIHSVAFSSANAMEIASDYDIIIDGTDNFATRYLVNDVCVLQGKPNCYGSIFQFDGQASVFGLPGGPCYRCLYPTPPDPGLIPNCAEGGVLGVLPGMIGTIQATEAIKCITGIGESLSGRLLLFDALSMRFRDLVIERNPSCPVCGDHPTIDALIDYQQFCGVPGKDAPQNAWDISASQLKRWIKEDRPLTILDVREPSEYQVRNLNGVLIPLGSLAKRIDELDASIDLVVHCQKGGRSAKAVAILQNAGFENVFNLKGGIDSWAD